MFLTDRASCNLVCLGTGLDPALTEHPSCRTGALGVSWMEQCTSLVRDKQQYGKVWSKDCLLSVEEDEIRDHLNWQNIPKSLKSIGMSAQALRAMTLRPLTVICGRLWQSRNVDEDQKKEDMTSICKGRARELQASQPHLSPQEGDVSNNPGNHL